MTLALSEFAANLMMLAGVGLLTAVLWLNVRKRSSGGGQKTSLDPREKLEQQRQVNQTKNDMRSVMVELQELTRHFASQLDAKAMKLEKLIEHADQRIAQLQRLQHGEQPTDQTGQEESDAPDQTDTSSPASTTEESGNTSAAQPAATDPLTERIHELAGQGHTANQIAQQLNEHVGKVELILALRQQSTSGSASSAKRPE